MVPLSCTTPSPPPPSPTHPPPACAAYTHMWNPYGRALMAIIPIKENMLLAEFKEKELDARLPLVRKKQTKATRKGSFVLHS